MGLVSVWYLLEDRRPDLEYGDSTATKKYQHSIKVMIAGKCVFTANIRSPHAGSVCFPQIK